MNYSNCFDSLPTVLSQSKFIFNITPICNDSSPRQVALLKFPYFSMSYLLRDWVTLEKIKRDHKYVSDLKQDVGQYFYDIINSAAPYGYEHEPLFLNKNGSCKTQYIDIAKPRVHSSSAHLILEDVGFFKKHSAQVDEIEEVVKKPSKFSKRKFTIEEIYETDEAIISEYYIMRAVYDIERCMIHTDLIKKHSVRHVFFKKSNQLCRYEGAKRKLVFHKDDIPQEMKSMILDYAKKNNKRVYNLLVSHIYKLSFAVIRKAFLNKMWVDLNSSYILDSFKSNCLDYRKLLYAYKTKGTKAARNFAYRTTNKALIRCYEYELARSDIGLAISGSQYLMLKQGYTAEKCLHIIKTLNKTRENEPYTRSPFHLYNEEFLEKLFFIQNFYPNFSLERVLTSKQGTFTVSIEVNDIYRSLNTIKSYYDSKNEPVVSLPEGGPEDLQRLSTRLSSIVTSFRDAMYAIPFNHTNDCKQMYDHEDEKYIYKFANSALQLKEMGSFMNICVGSYGERARNRSCDIVAVYEKSNPDVYFGCIEIRNVTSKNISINQAKMKRNAYAKSNKDFNASVYAWCQLKKINAEDCYDLHTPKQLEMLALRDEVVQINDYIVPAAIAMQQAVDAPEINVRRGGLFNGW